MKGVRGVWPIPSRLGDDDEHDIEWLNPPPLAESTAKQISRTLSHLWHEQAKRVDARLHASEDENEEPDLAVLLAECRVLLHVLTAEQDWAGVMLLATHAEELSAVYSNRT
jgi:hypothetical protein